MPLVADARTEEVMVSGDAAVAPIVNPADCVCAGDPLSVTLTVKVDALAEVGTPEMVPLEDSESPTGRFPEAIDQV